MKQFIWIATFLLSTNPFVLAQMSKVSLADLEKVSQEYAKTITQEDLSKHLHIVASDSMEGRMTGRPGQKKAARYIANHFQQLGLIPPVQTSEGTSYMQSYQRVSRSWDEVYIKVGDEKFEFLKDMYVLGSSNMQEETSMKITFGGLGQEEDLNKVNLQGNGVLIFEDDKDTRRKVQKIKAKGAKAVFVVKGNNQKEFAEAVEFNGFYLRRASKSLSNPKRAENVTYYVSINTAAKIMGTSVENLLSNKNKADFFKAKKINVLSKMVEEVEFTAENVMGFLEGGDKKEEILVITAHYDHIGKRGETINNGADDDGSGTVTVLELAEAFTKAKAEGYTPRRSILFMTVSGEELGLFGSRYYTDIDPIFPLENTVADLNIDMIGRIGGDYLKSNDPNYIYLIGSDKLSTELHELSEEANQKYINLKLDYKYNDDNDPNRFYYRSDHYNFANKNIPIIFYFNGTHPDYHRPTDTVDKIHFPKMEKIARLIFHTAWEIVNRETRLKVDKAQDR